MLAAFNSTFLTMIPKVDHVNRMDELIPISLCNCVYKLIAKILATRIKGIMLKYFTLEQFSFLEGRQIHDVIGIE